MNNHRIDRQSKNRGRSPPRIDEMASLKVDNISYRTTPEDLWRLFEHCDYVGDIYFTQDPYTRENSGFAFVRFYNKRDAEEAARTMNRRQLDGRELRVKLVRCGAPIILPGNNHQNDLERQFSRSSMQRRSRSRSPHRRLPVKPNRPRSPVRHSRSRSGGHNTFSGARTTEDRLNVYRYEEPFEGRRLKTTFQRTDPSVRPARPFPPSTSNHRDGGGRRHSRSPMRHVCYSRSRLSKRRSPVKHNSSRSPVRRHQKRNDSQNILSAAANRLQVNRTEQTQGIGRLREAYHEIDTNIDPTVRLARHFSPRNNNCREGSGHRLSRSPVLLPSNSRSQSPQSRSPVTRNNSCSPASHSPSPSGVQKILSGLDDSVTCASRLNVNRTVESHVEGKFKAPHQGIDLNKDVDYRCVDFARFFSLKQAVQTTISDQEVPPPPPPLHSRRRAGKKVKERKQRAQLHQMIVFATGEEKKKLLKQLRDLEKSSKDTKAKKLLNQDV